MSDTSTADEALEPENKLLESSPPQTHLRDWPDLGYLLHEWGSLYRGGSAGGSKAIRSHMARVRKTLSSVIETNPPVAHRAPSQLPVAAHFPRALDLGTQNSQSTLYGMCRALKRTSHLLTWEYGYTRVPRALTQKYGYCEILGPQGPVKTDRIVLGFVLFAPNTVYPQHSHADIEESYISLAGAWSENELAVYAPGSLILNRPGEEHRITTGRSDPCLLAYAWIGPQDRLTEPGMKFSRAHRRAEKGI
jgi:dimethylpropiothetin dethiomethylase